MDGTWRQKAWPLAAIGLLTSLLALATAATALAAPPKFSGRNLPVNSSKLFDLSVADIDGDHDLDLFSSNHKYRGTLLTSDGAGHFTDSLDRSGLSSTADIPGFDDLFATPRVREAGLYIWVDKRGVTHIQTVGLGAIPQLPTSRVSGEIRYEGRTPKVRKTRGASVDVDVDGSSRPASGVVSFDAGPNAEIVLRANFMDLPFDVKVDPLFPRGRILLGPRLSHPPASNFGFDLGDRHGVAWGDFNGDGRLDSYIANGGNRGAIVRFDNQAEDELYLGIGGGRFREDIAGSEITKGFCRGRAAAPVDYDGDGDLDVFVGCENLHPLLFKQRKPGIFGSQSHQFSQIGVNADLYRWVDLDGDEFPDLVAIGDRTAKVYEYSPEKQGFVKEQVIRIKRVGRVLDTVSFGDLDGDLDSDLFVGSRGGNTLLLNRLGQLKAVDPARRGLPSRGTVASSLVDYDNNGIADFHAVPQGLYQGRWHGPDFKRLGSVQVGGRARWAAASWLDLEGDGRRDLVALIKRQGLKLRKRIYDNRSPSGHWLQVDLEGPAANAQAIGAKVIVTTPGRRQAAWVGQAEGSRYSSGHYRLYFGLGPRTAAKSVEVRWPDGSKTKLKDVAADRLLEVAER